MPEVYKLEDFFVTTLSEDLTSSSTTINLATVPADVSKGYLVIEPSSATKREVIHFTSVGAATVTAADDTTDGSDATGRGCEGSITAGANTSHDQGAAVIISSVKQYWERFADAFDADHSLTDGTHHFTKNYDSNGNEVIEFDSTASAENHPKFTNATSSDPVIFEPTGDTSNIDMTIRPKGTGVVKIDHAASIQVVAGSTAVATGDGKYYLTIPKILDGANLVRVHGEVVTTTGSSGTTDIQIHNVTDGVDFLSTVLTIDSGESGSDTAVAPAVIDGTHDDVSENDLIRIDVDSIQSTGPSGLITRLEFAMP